MKAMNDYFDMIIIGGGLVGFAIKEVKRLEPNIGRDLGYLRREGSKKGNCSGNKM